MTFGVRARDFRVSRSPSTAQNLRTEPLVLAPVSLQAEVAWTVAYLRHQAPHLNEFLAARKHLQTALVSAPLKTAAEMLDRIEAQFGVSLWSIEQRLALLALNDGLEAQKSYAQRIRQTTNSGVVRFLTTIWSVRNEMATHFETFKRELVSRMPEWTESRPFANYALLRCADFWTPTPYAIGNALRWEFNNSTIDLYELFVRLAQRAVSTAAPTKEVMLAATGELVKSVNDDRLSALLFLGEGDPDRIAGLDHVATLLSDKYYAGEDLDPAPEDLADIEDIVAVSLELSNRPRIADARLSFDILSKRLVYLLSGVAKKGSRFEESRADLLHLYTNLTALDIGGYIHLATLDQVSSDVPSSNWFGIEAFSRTAKLHPGLLRFLSGAAKTTYAGILEARGLKGPTISAERLRAGMALKSSTARLQPELERTLQAQASFDAHKYQAVAELEPDVNDNHSVNTRYLARLVASSLIHTGQVKEAIRFIVKRSLADPNSVPMLPIAACYNAITNEINVELASDLRLVVLVELYSRHIAEQTTTLRYRYEDFLETQGCKKPSELKTKTAELPREPLIYFLRQVCIPRVMQLSLEFPTSRAVSDERLAVCVLLRDLDTANATTYDAEILEITRQRNISQGVQAVEQSKIWIDQEPIRRWAEKHLQEGFRRLIDLQAAGIVAKLEMSHNELEPITTEQIVKAIEVPELPTDEAGTLLQRLISQFLAHCFMNKPHGLDSFLSIRVRHGVFAGQMRAAPEAEKIITLQREAGSREYFPSAYWLAKFATGDRQVALRVDARLQQFSRDYDELMDQFVRDHFQIRREDKPLGLFRFGYLPTDLLVLQADLHKASSFDAFIDRCFQIFWNSVDASLAQIRDHIDHKLQVELNRLFVELINDLEFITQSQPHHELSYAVRSAHTRSTHALEQVKEWFRPARPRAPMTATFQELLDISLQVVRNMDPLFNPTLEVTAEDVPSFFQLQSFADIFIILFDNIRRHSGMGARPTVKVHARIEGGFLNVEITNSVALEVVNATNLGKLADIREKIDQGIFQRAVSTEGGTGLLKIRNIFSAEPHDPHLLEFGFEDGTFVVRLRISSVVVKVGETDDEDLVG